MTRLVACKIKNKPNFSLERAFFILELESSEAAEGPLGHFHPEKVKGVSNDNDQLCYHCAQHHHYTESTDV